MLKRTVSLLLVLLLLSGCSGSVIRKEQSIYEATFLTLFDTVTVIKGPAESEQAFSELSQSIYGELEYYHQLFDIYHDYEGLNNLKTVNDMAGIAPVPVDRAMIDLLTDCRSYYEMTGGKVNIAMGGVLKLWHEARTDALDHPDRASIPPMEALEAAADHSSFDAVIVDEEASTVYISDPNVRLDVGAVAKGWAAQRIAEKAPKGMLFSLGGNVCATGPKTASGTPWVIGIRDPDETADQYLHTLYVTGGSYVTSGDYQRAYMVDGVLYHHIIDPETLMPSRYWRSVTIVCDDSGLADALSTALFLMDREAGQQLLDICGAMALWVDEEGNIFYSPGFEEIIRT